MVSRDEAQTKKKSGSTVDNHIAMNKALDEIKLGAFKDQPGYDFRQTPWGLYLDAVAKSSQTEVRGAIEEVATARGLM